MTLKKFSIQSKIIYHIKGPKIAIFKGKIIHVNLKMIQILKLSVNDSKLAIKILFREVNKHVLIINLKKK